MNKTNDIETGNWNSDIDESAQLIDAVEEAAAYKAKTDFLFSMSHDLRTPLNAIIGFTNMAAKYIDDKEKVTDCLIKAQQSSELLLSLIDDILDMSRIGSGKMDIASNEGDVYLSFVNIESAMRELARVKQVDISFEISNIKDRYVYADFSRCIRVFVNLITNAINYTQAGGFVNVRCEQIGSKHGCGIYRYTVQDNGRGMSEEFQHHMFEEFAREDSETVSGVPGSGLGLTIVRSFVNTMNGSIECQSKKGEGTIFTVTLPFKLQENPTFTDPNVGKLVSGDTPLAADANIQLSGKKVLLVEDNDLNVEIEVDMLSEEGLSVDTASNGAEATEILKKKGPDYYDFILMDIQMPVMNGYEATRVIRSMYPDSKLPIIAISANAFEEDRASSLNAGMNYHLPKPITAKKLKIALSQFNK